MFGFLLLMRKINVSGLLLTRKRVPRLHPNVPLTRPLTYCPSVSGPFGHVVNVWLRRAM